jgi:hypothetical protein
MPMTRGKGKRCHLCRKVASGQHSFDFEYGDVRPFRVIACGRKHLQELKQIVAKGGDEVAGDA